jgi:thioesterase domain-containing protein
MNLPLAVIKELVENKVAFVARMNLKVLDLRAGYVKLFAPLQGNENHVGTMYAGALFTLAEIPGGALCLTLLDVSRFYPIVKEMNIRFLRPARTDMTIEASIPREEAERIRAEAEKKGKADFVIESEIKDETGEVVATSKGIYQARAVET